MAANSKSCDVFQVVYVGADGNFYVVWEMVFGMKGLIYCTFYTNVLILA